jgi:hypothetical protein
VIKLVIGPVVNGDTMKIVEFFDQKDIKDLKVGEELPYNVVEDLCIYMQNDPSFYRSHLYPVLVDVQEAVKNGGKYNKRKMIPTVEYAISEYIKKFDIKKRPQDLLQDSEKIECVNKILKNEMENFRKGEY